MFLAFRSEVEAALTTGLENLNFPSTDLSIEEPPQNVDAVLASSIAFQLASELGVPPTEITVEIANEIQVDQYKYIDAVFSQGPYLNFSPNLAYYTETLRAAQRETYGQLESRNESVIVEHTSANPTGPIHVGRARNPIIGDAIARILTFAGYDVERHYYVNDAGRQIAVFTWAYETFDEDDLPPPDRDRAEYDLVRYYRAGNTFLEEADSDEIEQAEHEITGILMGLEHQDPDTYTRVTEVVDHVLAGMRDCLSRLPATFDKFVKETQFILDNSTQDVIGRLQGLPEAEQKDGAWQLNLSEFDKSLVFLRSDGTSLYTTRDIAHHEWKLTQADRAVTVLGEDHQLQADQLESTLDRLGVNTDRLDQVFYSWVNLPEGGMSTRKGTGVNLDDLLDEAIDRARHEVKTRLETRIRDDELTEEDIDRIGRQVGIGAVRFDIISKQPMKGITFQWEEALDFESQSAPYVQYAHARACGILAEANDTSVNETLDAEYLATNEERELLREISRFPAVIDDAATDLAPHRIVTYTRQIAESFNAFYRECPVLSPTNQEIREHRIGVVIAAQNTIANALEVIGVEAPQSM